jgi:hypothetical protein
VLDRGISAPLSPPHNFASADRPAAVRLRHYHRTTASALSRPMNGGEPNSLSGGLRATHLAWKESTLAFVCYALPAPIRTVARDGSCISSTSRPLPFIGAPIRVSAVVCRGRVAGPHVVMGIWMRHRNWRSTDGKRYNECYPASNHHDEFPYVWIFGHSRGLPPTNNSGGSVVDHSMATTNSIVTSFMERCGRRAIRVVHLRGKPNRS